MRRYGHYVLWFLMGLVPVFAQAADRPAPELLLANVYSDTIDVRAYWVSEKLDGVRAYWDGSALISRQGNIYHAPAWFVRNFPDLPLDGELWMGRNTFARLSGIVRRQTPDEPSWRQVRFMVFDMPANPAPFDQRLAQLQALFKTIHSPYIELIEQFKVDSHAALMARLESVVAEGAEGLMLHKADSFYHAVRSDDLLKLKPYQDAEARVIAHLPGKGKYRGMLGALLVETEAGVQFRLGTGFRDAQRRHPPPVGSLVTYKYFGMTQRGVPRFASFLRVRED